MVKQLITTILLLSTLLFSLCIGEEMIDEETINEEMFNEERIDEENSCRILIDAHDRAAMMSRNFIGGQSNRWPNGVVPYVISSSFSSSQRQVIMNSIRHIQDRTCIRFVQRTNQQNYVDIFTGRSGCYANLGYNSRRTRSVVHLQSRGCVFLGTVVHELLHILGFGHEQTRPDRDTYVQINWANIRSGTYSNFWRALGERESTSLPSCRNVGISQYDRCHAGFRASTFGKAYDYGSVMHYGLNAFSTNGRQTITLRRQTSIRIPNRSGMSSLDAEKTRVTYGCSATATTLTTTTATTTTTTATTTTTTATTTPGPTCCQDTWQFCDRYTRLCGRHSFINARCKKTCFNCECKNRLGDAPCVMLKDYCRYSIIKPFCAKQCGVC